MYLVFVILDSVDFIVVSGLLYRLGLVLGRESVGGKMRMNKGKMRSVESVVKIVVVVIDLDGGELIFIDNV